MQTRNQSRRAVLFAEQRQHLSGAAGAAIDEALDVAAAKVSDQRDLVLLLEGQGVVLTRPEAPAPVVLGPDSPPFAFPGEWDWDCHLRGGPVRDFNVMVDRRLASATLERVDLTAGAPHRLEDPGDSLWLHGLTGRVRVAGETLEADETLGLTAPGALGLHADTEATVLVVRLTRLDGSSAERP